MSTAVTKSESKGNKVDKGFGVLLVNLGTPDDPSPAAVGRYLREFLSDPRVLDINPVGRFFLVNCIIAPIRKYRSSKAYKKIWTDEGSPLVIYGQRLAESMEEELGQPVRLAMRYQQPSMQAALDDFYEMNIDRIVVVPLFPQYASASWGSAIEHLFKITGERWNTTSLNVVDPYYDEASFVNAVADVARPELERTKPDKVLMSFHGLPERHCTKSDYTGEHCLKSDSCCDSIVEANRYCYRAQCFATARGVAKNLGLADDQYEVSFQSRLGRDPWIRPYTDYRFKELPGEGVKKLAVMCPSFTSDNLETLEEIAIEGRKDFLEAGGEEFSFIPCVNDHESWVRGLIELVRANQA